MMIILLGYTHFALKLLVTVLPQSRPMKANITETKIATALHDAIQWTLLPHVDYRSHSKACSHNVEKAP